MTEFLAGCAATDVAVQEGLRDTVGSEVRGWPVTIRTVVCIIAGVAVGGTVGASLGRFFALWLAGQL